MDNQLAPMTATFTVPNDLAAEVERALADGGRIVERRPGETPGEGPSSDINFITVLSVISTVASMVKACLDIRELLLRRRERKRVEVQLPDGAALSIGADSDARALAEAVQARFGAAS